MSIRFKNFKCSCRLNVIRQLSKCQFFLETATKLNLQTKITWCAKAFIKHGPISDNRETIKEENKMRFFRKIDIGKLKKSETKNECLSNGSIKPLENPDEEFEKWNGTPKERGEENLGFKNEDYAKKEQQIEEMDSAVKRMPESEDKTLKKGIKKKPSENMTNSNNHDAEDNLQKKINLNEKKTRERKTKSRRQFSNLQKLHSRIYKCLDHPNLTHWVALILISLATWGIIYSIAGAGFLPGSQLFSLLALFVLAFIGGELTKLIKLPPLLGMLLIGILLRNIKFIHLDGVYLEVTATLREIALCIILIRAGLGLDIKALKSLKFVILRLALIPGIVEGVITTIVTHFLLKLPWLWGMLLGAILAAVSPAVVIPCLFGLQEKGYGKGKGIPTLVVAAASLDDIFAITVFGVIFSVIYSTGQNVAMQIVQGPVGILIGIVYGIVWGFVAHFIPHQKDDHVVLLRVLMIVAGGLVAVVGSGAIGYQGAGPLGCIIAAFVACSGWRKQNYSDEHNPVSEVFRVIWLIFQPILFGLIGSEVDVSVLEASTVGYGLMALFCSLLGRIVISVFIAYGAEFEWKEKIFIAWAWFPKATVQAALGPLALDTARRNGSEEEISHARKILILAVLAILFTAPLGSVLITTLGPRLLTKAGEYLPEKEKAKEEVNLESNKSDTENKRL